MSGETILSDFCAICHVNAIKYTCPRCGVHTCSLPCVKKHKAWAQCSGERNPAEYRKRTELATSSSIDKDFNFITSVERSITRADQGILDRGINLAPARQIKSTDSRPKWEIEAEQRHITIIKAPKGLSRSKQTKTHWVGQHKCITWTVEWVCPDNEKIFAQSLENKSVGEAFFHTVGKKTIQRKRRLSKENDTSQQKSQKPSLDSSPHPLDADRKPQEVERRNSSTETLTVVEGLLVDHHFYLHKPNTPSKFKCLIPLAATASLREILDDQVLLEFPTVYVKYESPDQLSAPFITETDYTQRHATDIPINLGPNLEDGEVEDVSTAALPTNVDALKVLEVLGRDLAG